MAEYRFLTTWVLGAPRDRIWEAIWDSERWPRWWPGVTLATELDPGRPDGVGRCGRYEWRSRIPYPVRFEVVATRVERPALLEGEARGDLAGTGRWRLLEQDRVTVALYEWNVRTTKRWMNAVAPLAAPILRWNHDELMRAGGRGLARLLEAELLACSSSWLSR